MTSAYAGGYLDNAEKLAEAHNVTGLMNLIDDNARIIDKDKEQTRFLLIRAFRNAGADPITLSWKNLNVTRNNDTAILNFDLDVGQNMNGITVNWAHSHFDMILQKTNVPHWLGLYTTQEWKIIKADTDLPLDQSS
jgi:hypothetical protein